MSPSPISTHIPQPLNIILQLPSQIILQNHRAQFLCQVVDLFVFEIADSSGVVNVEASHESLADFWADAVEGLERCADEMRFGEVGAEDEDLDTSLEEVRLMRGEQVYTMIAVAEKERRYGDGKRDGDVRESEVKCTERDNPLR